MPNIYGLLRIFQKHSDIHISKVFPIFRLNFLCISHLIEYRYQRLNYFLIPKEVGIWDVLIWSIELFSISIPVPPILSFKSWGRYKLIRLKVNEPKVNRKYSVVLILLVGWVTFSGNFIVSFGLFLFVVVLSALEVTFGESANCWWFAKLLSWITKGFQKKFPRLPIKLIQLNIFC